MFSKIEAPAVQWGSQGHIFGEGKKGCGQGKKGQRAWQE